MTSDRAPVRLNWGCGPRPAPGWINADLVPVAGVDLPGDIRDGLGLPDGSCDYIVAIHVLQDLLFVDLDRAVSELLRVLKPGGVLRLGLPDLDRAIDAYLRGDGAYFHVPDGDTRTVSGKLCVQISWYGSVRTPFTFAFAEEILSKNGFGSIRRCAFHRTASRFPDIVSLDNRERESLFVEASR